MIFAMGFECWLRKIHVGGNGINKDANFANMMEKALQQAISMIKIMRKTYMFQTDTGQKVKSEMTGGRI